MALGIDMVYIPRLIGKDDLAKKLLSDAELEIYQTKANKAEFFAGRFACKEAFYKATKGTIKNLNFHDISVTYDQNGAPVLTYKGQTYDVSIAHDGDYAIAIVNI